MKKLLFLILLIFSQFIFAQKTYVTHDHKVYTFLERMDALNIIENYDEFSYPKSILEIKKFLLEVRDRKENLNETDKKILNDLNTEFEYFIKGTTDNYNSLLNGDPLLDQHEKFLYFYNDHENAAFFVNVEANAGYHHSSDLLNDRNRNITLIKFGGSIEGIIKNKFGFFIRGTNGTYSGNKSLAQEKTNLRYNYKFNRTDPGNSGNDYFDETEGFLFADFEFIKFKIGRDRNVIGFGDNKPVLSNDPPPMDYFSFELKYKKFGFSFLHGKLLGSLRVEENLLTGAYNQIADKYFVYHRFHLDLNRHLNIGLGETVIYADRSIDLSYLNPFNFYKSVEHLNQDRDNTMLFVDISNKSVLGLKLYGTLLIDDIDFSKTGTGWFGNKLLYQFGFYSTQLYDLVPIQIKGEYLKIQPYVYTHRISENNYTNLEYSLAYPLQPNSQVFSLGFEYQPHYRIDVELSFKYTEHGSNYFDSAGEFANVGGDINTGHRKIDPEYINFLDGKLECSRLYSLSIIYEPVNNYSVQLNAEYLNENLAYPQKEFLETFYSSFAVKVKL